MARVTAVWWGALLLALLAVYWVVGIVEPLRYRALFLLVALAVTFLDTSDSPLAEESHAAGKSHATGDSRGAWRARTGVALALLAVLAFGWPVLDIAAFPYRAATPSATDLMLGTLGVALVLEATRRTAGWILPATAILFIVYAWAGPMLELIGLDALAHRGYYPDRLVGTLYMTLDGIFGTPLDVASTYIILFAIFGAVLQASGAGRFFIDWSLSAMRRRDARGTTRASDAAPPVVGDSAPGRAVTLAGFLLGTVSGSGVATTVTLGSVAWPLLRRAGCTPEVGGAMLSAAGIGALLSPPTMGAAAFLIAEFLGVPFVRVVAMAVVPALLYYLSALVMIEADSARLRGGSIGEQIPSVGALTARYWPYFVPLVAVVALLLAGFTPFRAVLWATGVAVAVSFRFREHALRPFKLAGALASGARASLGVIATTATAGIIVGMVTLTGLGLRVSGLVVDLAGGSTALTVLYAAIAVWLLGLAVPVTASYIIAAVMVAPALTEVGVPLLAAHMFIFYYAVLSEVTPPTALSPFAAAALTGGNPFRTMMLTWKYTLPAFVVPFVFTLAPDGMGLLLEGSVATIAVSVLRTGVGIAALAAAIGGWWPGRRVSIPVRIALALGGAAALFAGAV